MKAPRAIAIGTSAGGVSAVQDFLRGTKGKLSLPIFVVQHLPANARIEPALIYGPYTHAKVVEAQDKMPVEPDHVYFAPPGYHLLIERELTLSLTQDEPVHFSRPSIDVLFESAARAYGSSLCGILLTGANADGAAGLQTIQTMGGITMVHDPSDAEVPAMPLAALNLIRPNFTGSVGRIAAEVAKISQSGAGS